MSTRTVFRYAYTMTACLKALQPDRKLWAPYLSGTGIEAAELSAPYLRINQYQELKFLQNVLARHPEPGVGLRLGSAIGLRHVGALGFAVRTCATVEQAIQFGQRHRCLAFPDVRWTTFCRSGKLVHRLSVSGHTPELQQLLIEIGLSILVTQGIELVESPIRPSLITLRRPALRDAGDYRRLLGDRVVFATRENELHYSMDCLNYPLVDRDPVSAQSMAALCDSLATKLSAEDDVVIAVQAILAAASDTMPSVDAVADSLALSPRSLRRHLTKRGTSFQQLLDGERRQRAETLLADSEQSVRRVAHACGYEELRSFYHAFQRWTGCTPAAWRKSQASQSI